MNSIYEGFYTRFSTASKKDAAALLGADNLVGAQFDIVFKIENGTTTAWLKNRFGVLIGFLESDATQQLRILQAREWETKALLSFVAFTDKPEPGYYWGEVAIICYDSTHHQEFEQFSLGIAKRLMDGVRPSVDLGEQGIEQVLTTNGAWSPTKTVPLPAKKSGTAIMKSRRKASEKLIEQGRKGNKGCYFISWAFLLVLVAVLLFSLKTCGVF